MIDLVVTGSNRKKKNGRRNSTLVLSVYEKEKKKYPEAKKSTGINLSYKLIKYILNLVSTSANGSPGSRRATLFSSVFFAHAKSNVIHVG